MENLALYSSESIGHRHLFCKVCGIHIFNVDSQFPELVGVNVHCLDHPNLNVRVSFVPTSISSAFEMVAKERTTDTTSEYSCRTDDYRQARFVQEMGSYYFTHSRPLVAAFKMFCWLMHNSIPSLRVVDFKHLLDPRVRALRLLYRLQLRPIDRTRPLTSRQVEVATNGLTS